MAGGMGRRTGPTLGERTASADGSDPLSRHCWVAVADGLARHPGLLLEWRRDGPDGWSGLVVYVPDDAPEGVRLVQQWVPASRLTPRPG